MNARFYFIYDNKITLNLISGVISYNLDLTYATLLRTFSKNLQISSVLSILFHGVISLSDATSYDKKSVCFNNC